MLIENKSSEHDSLNSSNVPSIEEQQQSKPFEEELKSEVSEQRVVSRTPNQ